MQHSAKTMQQAPLGNFPRPQGQLAGQPFRPLAPAAPAAPTVPAPPAAPLFQPTAPAAPTAPLVQPTAPVVPTVPAAAPVTKVAPALVPLAPIAARVQAPACEGHTFEYVMAFSLAAFLLSIILGMLFEYWLSGSDCISRSQFGSLVFYSFVAAALVGIVTFVAHSFYCKSK